MAGTAHLLSLLNAEGYDVQRELGQGQFGKVVLAKQRASGELVAVKVVAESFSSENERSMIGRPQHPNVLQIFKSLHDTTLDVNVCFLEYCNGGDLQARLERTDQALGFREMLILTTQIASGLLFLHSNNISHRDIKPANILLNVVDDWTTYKLGDFGTAREKTMMETLAGTPYFMAPEVEDGSGYSKEIDQWSLGCTLFYCCTLRQLFDARNRADLRDMVHRPITPEAMRERLVAEARCKFNEVERERMAFTISALIQIVPTQRMAILDLLQQVQPVVHVTDVRKGEEHAVPINLAARPTVKNLSAQVAAVFERAPENLYLHNRHGELTDDYLAANLWGALQLRLMDIEAYLSASDSPAVLEEGEFELIEVHDSPDAEHALKCLPSKAHGQELRFKARLPELESALCLRDSVAREIAAATAMIDKLRMAKSLLSSIKSIPEHTELVNSIVAIERHIGAADSVLRESASFFSSTDSPIVALAYSLQALQLPPSPRIQDLPQLLHKHLGSASARTEEFGKAQREVLRNLLRNHTSLAGLFAPHGAVTRATQALERYHAQMQSLVEQTAHTHAEQNMTATVGAAVSQQVAAARAEGAAALAKATQQHAAQLARAEAEHTAARDTLVTQLQQARVALGGAETALREAQMALAARETELGLPASTEPFGVRLTTVLNQFYERGVAEASVTAAATNIPLKIAREELEAELGQTQQALRERDQNMAALKQHTEKLQTDVMAVQQVAAQFKQEIESAHRDKQELESQVAHMAADIADKERTTTQLRERLTTFEAQTHEVKGKLDATVQSHTAQEAKWARDLDEKEQIKSAVVAENEALKKRIIALQDDAQQARAIRAQLETQFQALHNESDARITAIEKERVKATEAATQMSLTVESSKQRILQLENAMRDSAMQLQQLQTNIRAKDQHIDTLQAENTRLAAAALAINPSPAPKSASARPPVPQFTPPPVVPAANARAVNVEVAAAAVAAAGAAGVPARGEIEALRAEKANLVASVQQLQVMLTDARQRNAKTDQDLAAAMRTQNELESERDRMREVVVTLRRQIDEMQEHQHQQELGSVESQLLRHLQAESEQLTRSLTETREELVRAQEALSDEQTARQHLEREFGGLQEHIRELAEENMMLQRRGGDEHGRLIVEITQFLFRNAELVTLEDCVARLRQMLARRADYELLTMSNVQYGDPVFVLNGGRILQHKDARALTLNPDSGDVAALAGRVLAVVFVDEENSTVHVSQ